MVKEMNLPDFFTHETAIVDEGATIGNGTKIWHFCHVMKGAIIGENCILGQNVFVANGVVIGNGVKIQNNVSLYTGVIIEEDVFLGPSMVFTNVLQPRAFIERKAEYLPTVIQKGATIGANATIICGATVGAYAMVGAGTVVRQNILPFALVVGNPARMIGWVGRSGRRLIFDEDGILEGEKRAFCSESNEYYRLFEGKVEIIV